MELCLLLHGVTFVGFPDSSRPLSAFGREQISNLALEHRMASAEIKKVVSSAHVRAVQSAEILVGAAGPKKTIKWLDDLTPQGDLCAIEEFLQSTAVETVLMVSHLPLAAKLIDYLTGESGTYIRTGSLASISMPFFGRRTAQLNWIQYADEIY